MLILEKYKSDDYMSGSSSSNLAAALIDSNRNRNTKGNLSINIGVHIFKYNLIITRH